MAAQGDTHRCFGFFFSLHFSTRVKGGNAPRRTMAPDAKYGGDRWRGCLDVLIGCLFKARQVRATELPLGSRGTVSFSHGLDQPRTCSRAGSTKWRWPVQYSAIQISAACDVLHEPVLSSWCTGARKNVSYAWDEWHHGAPGALGRNWRVTSCVYLCTVLDSKV